MKIMKNLFVFTLLMLSSFILAAQQHGQQDQKEYYPPKDPIVQQNLEQWQDNKFGVLLCWGAYTQWGIVESWALCSEDEPWCARENPSYEDFKREYVNLKKTFNPAAFNPERWASAMKGAGVKYMLFSAKHHDGYCMWDTKYTDYKITSKESPFHTNKRANVAKEVFSAFQNEGVSCGVYFSKPDWNTEYYWWPRFATPDRNVNYDIKKYPERWENYVQFTQNQVDELISDYGKIDILWFDGGWVSPWNNQDIRMNEIAANARKKQPGMIVVDREVKGEYQDYMTPEWRIPGEVLPYPWETCMPIGGSWVYTPNDNYRTSAEVVAMLVDICSKGGNLLLGVGPGPDGELQPQIYKTLEGVGRWMDVNSEAIYGSRAYKVFSDGDVCFTRSKDNSKIYAIRLIGDNEDLPSKIVFKNDDVNKGTKMSILGRGQVKFSVENNIVTVQLPKMDRTEAVVLRMDI